VRLTALGIAVAGQAALDLGTGTGSLARGLAGLGCRVTGLDPSADMLAAARRIADEEGLEIRFVQGKAEATGLDGGAFDLVAAGQCWHWFDRSAAAAETRRLLRAGGCVLICHFDWLPLPGNTVAATEALIQAHNPGWPWAGGTGIHAAWLADLGNAGFTGLESFTFDQDVPYSHEAWRGRIRASAGVGGSLPAEAVARFDRELAALLARDFPDQPLAVPHRVFAVHGRSPTEPRS